MSDSVRAPITEAVGVPYLIRERCKTCTRSYNPRELLAGTCSECLLKRVEAHDKGNLAAAAAKAICQNCGRKVWAMAYCHWDTQANDFAYLCIPCGDDAIATAEQYRGTEFGYKHKV